MQEKKVTRGGSWINRQDLARADYRNYYHPSDRFVDFGFRVCKRGIK